MFWACLSQRTSEPNPNIFNHLETPVPCGGCFALPPSGLLLAQHSYPVLTAHSSQRTRIQMQHFTARDGLTLAYQDEGEGLPVLALAGLTRNSDDFNFVAPHLSRIRLIRMDYRGRGSSDWGPYQTYSVPQEADDALMLLDHLGIDQAAILGTSRGGLIAMGIAATAKDRLLGACLNDIGPVIDPRGLDYIKGFLGRRPSARFYKDAADGRATNHGGLRFSRRPNGPVGGGGSPSLYPNRNGTSEPLRPRPSRCSIGNWCPTHS